MKSFRTPATGRAVRRAAAASLIALAGASATAPAATAQSPSIAGGIALLPGGKAERLEFKTRPGGVVEGTVRLKNGGRTGRTVQLSAVDLGTASFGGAVYGETAKKEGRWLTLGRKTVNVPARTVRTVRFAVRVPASARSGVHYAGITAADAAQLQAAKAKRGGAKKKSIVFHRIVRMALPVKLELPGPASPRLQLRGAKTRVDAVGTQAALTLQNTGGTLVRSTGVNLKMTKGARVIASSRQPMREFVPGTSTAYPLEIPGVPAPGEYRITGRITPAGGPALRVNEVIRINGRTIAKAKRSLQGRAPQAAAGGGISPIVWGAIGGLGLVTGILGVLFARMRRRLKAVTAAAAAGSATDPARERS